MTHHGRWTTVEDHTLGPRPVQRPSPPIWVAAVRTEATYRWAGENGFHLLTAPFFFPIIASSRHCLRCIATACARTAMIRLPRQVMAVYHMYCAENDADVAAFADPALRRYQAFTKATDLSRQAYRDPVAYKDWKGFFENRETITLEQMKAERAVIGRAGRVHRETRNCCRSGSASRISASR